MRVSLFLALWMYFFSHMDRGFYWILLCLLAVRHVYHFWIIWAAMFVLCS